LDPSKNVGTKKSKTKSLSPLTGPFQRFGFIYRCFVPKTEVTPNVVNLKRAGLKNMDELFLEFVMSSGLIIVINSCSTVHTARLKELGHACMQRLYYFMVNNNLQPFLI
jgi:hypothetical protein